MRPFGIVLVAVGGVWAAWTGAAYVTLALIGVVLLADDLLIRIRDLARLQATNAESIASLAAVSAFWMERVGVRVGMTRVGSWVCRVCLQTNDDYVETCGRCDAERYNFPPATSSKGPPS
jgi:hypothetical protein